MFDYKPNLKTNLNHTTRDLLVERAIVLLESGYPEAIDAARAIGRVLEAERNANGFDVRECTRQIAQRCVEIGAFISNKEAHSDAELREYREERAALLHGRDMLRCYL